MSNLHERLLDLERRFAALAEFVGCNNRTGTTPQPAAENQQRAYYIITTQHPRSSRRLYYRIGLGDGESSHVTDNWSGNYVDAAHYNEQSEAYAIAQTILAPRSYRKAMVEARTH